MRRSNEGAKRWKMKSLFFSLYASILTQSPSLGQERSIEQLNLTLQLKKKRLKERTDLDPHSLYKA